MIPNPQAVLVILNRPTGNEVELRLPAFGNEPVRRRVFFGGDMALTNSGDGLVMLQAGGRPGPHREECGESGACAEPSIPITLHSRPQHNS